MRIYKFFLFSFLLFLSLDSSSLHAQFISQDISIGDTTQVHVLNTENGDRFVGRVTKIENTTVFFLFQNTKELEFTLSEIRSLVLYSEQKSNGDSQNEIQNSDYLRAKKAYEERRKNRNKKAVLNGEENLFFSPTSYTLGKGKKEYRNLLVFYNRIDLGLTDNLDIGFDLLPLISSNIFAARIKAGVPLSDFINIGFGGSIYTVIQPNFFGRNVSGTTHTYGTATFGTIEKFINIGFGYAFPFRPNDSNAEGSSLITFGGALRIAKRWKIIADFILLGIDDEPDFYSIGASWFSDKHRLDFGINTLATPGNSFLGPIVPVPFASYAFSFGK